MTGLRKLVLLKKVSKQDLGSNSKFIKLCLYGLFGSELFNSSDKGRLLGAGGHLSHGTFISCIQ